jgi:hypothetical protein
MMTTIVIDNNSPQAKQFVRFARTLPFVEVKRSSPKPQSVWNKAIAEGAVTVDEFFDEVSRQIKEHYDNA